MPLPILPLLLLLLALPAAAQPARPDAARQQELRAAEQARADELAARRDAAARAERAQAEEARLAQDRVATAAKLREAEGLTADAAARLEQLALRKSDAESRLAARADAMQPLLPLIQRLSLHPAETLLAIPAPPEDRLRAVIVLQRLSRDLESEARALRRDQAELDEAAAAIARETPAYKKLLAAQAERAAELDRLIAQAQSQRRQAETDAEAASKRAQAEAQRADTIRSALAALEAQRKAEEARAREEALRAERRKQQAEADAARAREAALARPPGLPPQSQPKGQLQAPVAGRVVREWGAATEAGPATGVSFQAAPDARVVAPCGGRVVFADRFRSYGLLAIVDCGGGYHMVLSGFERLDARAGQAVRAGEPLGAMPNWDPSQAGRRPALYVELRQDGQPTNPLPWLRAGGG